MENSISTEELDFRARFMRNLNALHAKEELCDVILQSRDQHNVKCHGVVLAAVSEKICHYLENLKCDDHDHVLDDVSDHVEDENVLLCDSLNKENVEEFASYVYTGRITISLDSVVAFAETSIEFGMSELQEFCESFMLTHVDLQNCFLYNHFSKKYNFKRLQLHTDAYRSTYAEQLLESERLLDLDVEQLVSYLEEDVLCIRSEDCVLDAALRWLCKAHRCNDSSLSPDTIQQILGAVRFEYCSTHRLCKLLVEDGFVQHISAHIQKPLLLACLYKASLANGDMDPTMWRQNRAKPDTVPDVSQLPDAPSSCSEVFVTNGYSESLLSTLYKLKLKASLTDVELNSSDGDKIACHRVVLAAGWRFFRAMFTSNMSESSSHVVDLPSMDTTTIVCIINHLYNFRTILSPSNVRNLLHTCHMLEVDDLTKDCERYMMDDIDVTNCIDYYQDAALFQLQHLKQKARRYILCKYEQVCVSDRFLSLKDEELVDLISSDQLTVECETTVLGSVEKWLQTNQNVPQQKQCEIISCIRFSQLSCDYTEALRNHPMMQHQQLQQLISSPQSNANSKPRSGLLNEKLVTISKSKYIVCLSPEAREHVYLVKRHVSVVGDLTSTFTVTSSGILATGGMYCKRCVAYDVKRDETKVYTELLHPRWGHGAIVENEMLYVCGGYDGRRSLNTMHVLDMKVKVWKTLTDMRKSANWPIVASIGDKIFVMGGMESISMVQIYSKRDNRWTCGAPMPRPCDSTRGGAVVHHGKIHVICHTHFMRYCPDTDTWHLISHDRIGKFISQPFLYQGQITVFSVRILDKGQKELSLKSMDAGKPLWSVRQQLDLDLSCFYISPWNYIIKPFLCVKCPVM